MRDECFIDIETTFEHDHSQENKLILIVFKYKNRHFVITFKEEMKMLEEFWELYYNLGCPKLYAHNGIRFDFKYLIKFLPNVKIMLLGSEAKPYGWQFIYRDKMLTWFDTTAIIPTSLAKIGITIGMPKGKLIEYRTNETITVKGKKYQELIKYCINDVEILAKFRQFFPLGIKPKLTIASTALNYFFNTKKLVRFTEEDIDEVYRGGMTECFKPRGKYIYDLDINSSYPNVMKLLPSPYKKPVFTKDRDAHKAGIYYIEIEKTPKHILLSPLSIKSEIRGLKIAKKGQPSVMKYVNFKKSKIWASSPELDFLEYHGYDYTIKAGYEVPYVDMSAQIEELYRLRNSKEEYKYPIKILLNSAYGKFAQKDERPLVFISNTDSNIDYLMDRKQLKKLNGNRKITKLNNTTTISLGTYDICTHRNILVASNITAAARINLANYAYEAGIDNLFYSDTDSIFVNDEGMQRLSKHLGSSLGKLKLEAEAYKGSFYARKCYRINSTSPIMKLKGTPYYARLKIKWTGNTTSEAFASGFRESTVKEFLKTGKQNTRLEKIYSMDLRRYRQFEKEESKPYTVENMESKFGGEGQMKL